MSAAVTKKPPAGGVGRVSHDSSASPSSSLSRSNSRSSTPSSGGHARTRSVRTGTPVSARAAISRRDTGPSSAETDARAEAASVIEDLQKRLETEEKQLQQSKRQADVLRAKLDDAVKESAKLEEKIHEFEEQIEILRNEKREGTRQMREMESIYEAERSSILKEKEEMANREEEMQTVIQRLKDSLAQRNNDDENRPSRQRKFHPTSFIVAVLIMLTRSLQPTRHPRSTAAALHHPLHFSAATRETVQNLSCKRTNSSNHCDWSLLKLRSSW